MASASTLTPTNDLVRSEAGLLQAEGLRTQSRVSLDRSFLIVVNSVNEPQHAEVLHHAAQYGYGNRGSQVRIR
ncbi:hypothetical protein RHRU231_800004 [Rhodococcus ruber]|uniref:Uncharacterized protein n=1 Tax=Rhodococcus ruber TaxID=1830 RepID=A0A098BS53_9NOCA|nr:hypothetical protein RHRU231_800004 [Rhodococcus ruber]